jgi:peptidoglycan hydrolase-like protein with peptidoglycan-binding domain
VPKSFRRALPVAVVAALVPVSVGVPTVQASHNGKKNWHLGDRAPLKQGQRGKDIRILQDFLTRAGHRTSVDGHFGRGTARSVRAFERKQKRKADGRLTASEIRLLRRVADQRAKLRTQSTPDATTATGKATLNPDGTAVPPADAPPEVVKIIEAGNKIAKKPYRYGGGHGRWEDSGYDCSGSVSYALKGADLVKSPMASGGYTSWGEAGKGKWVTTYANSGHVYMVVAGLRFDTSARKQTGNRWTTQSRTSRGYVVRHPEGL